MIQKENKKPIKIITLSEFHFRAHGMKYYEFLHWLSKEQGINFTDANAIKQMEEDFTFKLNNVVLEHNNPSEL